jgi:hypothetical protein
MYQHFELIFTQWIFKDLDINLDITKCDIYMCSRTNTRNNFPFLPNIDFHFHKKQNDKMMWLQKQCGHAIILQWFKNDY